MLLSSAPCYCPAPRLVLHLFAGATLERLIGCGLTGWCCSSALVRFLSAGDTLERRADRRGARSMRLVLTSATLGWAVLTSEGDAEACKA